MASSKVALDTVFASSLLGNSVEHRHHFGDAMLYIQRSKQPVTVATARWTARRPGGRFVGGVVEIYLGVFTESIEAVKESTTTSMISSVCSDQSTSSAGGPAKR